MHDLDTRANGDAAMFSVNETPWHRLGTVLAGAPNLEEALILSGTSFEVELQQLSRLLPDGGYEPVDQFATVRTDTDTVLGHGVGTKYTVLQNRDAWRVLEPLVDAGLASFETGGSLRGGADVWMMLKLNLPDRIAEAMGGAGIVPYAMISNNHTGNRSVVVQNTTIRTVCRNTLMMALSKGKKDGMIRVPHTGSVASKVNDAARDLWAGIIERQGTMALQYQKLSETFLSEDQFRKLVLDVIAPEHPAAKLEPWERTARNETSIRKVMDRRQAVRSLWEGGAGHTGNHSAWEAFNAVVESVDHNREQWKASDELASLMDGKLARVKQAAINSLYSFAVAP